MSMRGGRAGTVDQAGGGKSKQIYREEEPVFISQWDKHTCS